MMKTPMHKISCAAALAASFMATPACAQDVKLKRDGTLSVILVIDGKSVRIDFDGENFKATSNGKELPDDRIEKSGGRLIVRDGDDNPVASVFNWAGGLTLSMLPRSNRATIGIELDPLPQGLADHLDLDPDGVIYVTRAIKGRAAAKAGLKDHDVIVRIDGDAPANESSLRAVLKKKKPGDDLEVQVLRRGRTHDFTIRCERAKGGGFGVGGAVTDLTRSYPLMSWQNVWHTHNKKSVDAYKKALKAFNRINSSKVKWPKDYENHFKQARDAMRKLQTQFQNKQYFDFVHPPLFSVGKKSYTYLADPSVGRVLGFDRDGKDLYVVDPQFGKAYNNFITGVSSLRKSGGSVGKSDGSVEKKLKTLEKRFDRIEKMIQKLVDREKIR